MAATVHVDAAASGALHTLKPGRHTNISPDADIPSKYFHSLKQHPQFCCGKKWHPEASDSFAQLVKG